jgi:LL-diaminopimelate aminotransferase
MLMKPATDVGINSKYIFSALLEKAAAVEKNSGQKVLNFAVGEPDVMPCSDYTNEYSRLVADTTLYRYPGYGATDHLTTALIKWYRDRFGANIEPLEILPLNGAKDGIAHLPLAILSPGDEILVPNPGYPAFSKPALFVGAIPVYYDLLPENDYKLDYSNIRKRLSDKTKYMWVNYPSNPTGQIATLEDLKALVTFAHQHDIFVLYDNAYSEITFDGFRAPSILTIEGAKEIAIEIGSFSKSFSFAGLRMGWAIGNADVILALKNTKSQYDSGMSLPLQELGAYVLSHPNKNWRKMMIESYQSRRMVIASYLESLDMKVKLTKGSLYIWAELPSYAQDADIYCENLLENKHVLLTPGTAFGDNGKRFVRVSIGVNVDAIKYYI